MMCGFAKIVGVLQFSIMIWATPNFIRHARFVIALPRRKSGQKLWCGLPTIMAGQSSEPTYASIASMSFRNVKAHLSLRAPLSLLVEAHLVAAVSVVVSAEAPLVAAIAVAVATPEVGNRLLLLSCSCRVAVAERSRSTAFNTSTICL